MAGQENNIGQDHALYYEAYATFLELRGHYAKAEAEFEAGINRLNKLSVPGPLCLACTPNLWSCCTTLHSIASQSQLSMMFCCGCRKAHPVDRLRNKRNDFQHRMVRHLWFAC